MTRHLRTAGHLAPEWKGSARGPSGRGLCRGCLDEVPKGRKTWCGDQCVQRHVLANGGPALRRYILDRDHGVCSICALDTVEAERRLDDVRRGHGQVDSVAVHVRYRDERHRLRGLGFTIGISFWQADHLIPLAEGGTNVLANYRTLCVPCHKRETAALRKRLARRNREQRDAATGQARIEP